MFRNTRIAYLISSFTGSTLGIPLRIALIKFCYRIITTVTWTTSIWRSRIRTNMRRTHLITGWHTIDRTFIYSLWISEPSNIRTCLFYIYFPGVGVITSTRAAVWICIWSIITHTFSLYVIIVTIWEILFALSIVVRTWSIWIYKFSVRTFASYLIPKSIWIRTNHVFTITWRIRIVDTIIPIITNPISIVISSINYTFITT